MLQSEYTLLQQERAVEETLSRLVFVNADLYGWGWLEQSKGVLPRVGTRDVEDRLVWIYQRCENRLRPLLLRYFLSV